MSTDNVNRVIGYPLLEALVKRRSRRFALGMKMDSGPLAYQSRQEPLPLTEEEEALLVFAASGMTGYALLDLPFTECQGGATLGLANLLMQPNDRRATRRNASARLRVTMFPPYDTVRLTHLKTTKEGRDGTDPDGDYCRSQ